MLRVTIELIPGGNEARKRTLGVAHIINVEGDAETANYTIHEMLTEGSTSYTVHRKPRLPNCFRFIANVLRLK